MYRPTIVAKDGARRLSLREGVAQNVQRKSMNLILGRARQVLTTASTIMDTMVSMRETLTEECL